MRKFREDRMTRTQSLMAQIAAASTVWVLIGLAGYWRAHGVRLPREVSDALDAALKAAGGRD